MRTREVDGTGKTPARRSLFFMWQHNHGVIAMSGLPSPTEDKYARGLGLASNAILVHLLKALMAKGALNRTETRQLLEDAMKPFIKPHQTDEEAVAAVTINQIRTICVLPVP